MTYIPNAAYDAATTSNRSYEIYPISHEYTPETLADVTNGTDATYEYYVSMPGSRKAGFQLSLGCTAGTVTVTIEGTLQDDGTVAASCDYQDITNDTFGVASLVATASTAEDMWIDNSEKLALFRYLKIKVVAATTANTGDWTIYHRRLY